MPGDDPDWDGRDTGWLPSQDSCWPVAELAACRDDIRGHMHHRGRQASLGWRAAAPSGLATSISAVG
jgi:hypothetical protein